MSPQSVDSFMSQVLSDEGWMSPLDERTIAETIGRLESWLPAGGTVTDACADLLWRGLRQIATRAQDQPTGAGDEFTWVKATLDHLEQACGFSHEESAHAH